MARDEPFLKRWSRLKSGAKDETREPAAEPPAAPAPAAAIPAEPPASAAPLPPVESLTPESDFTPFMRPEVKGSVKRAALKTLFRDPRFNVMDGLDVYIDDYSKPDPLPEGWLEKLEQVVHLGDHAAAAADTAAQSPAAKAPEATGEQAERGASAPEDEAPKTAPEPDAPQAGPEAQAPPPQPDRT